MNGVRAAIPEGWVRPEPWQRPWKAWAAGALVVAALAAGFVRLAGADGTATSVRTETPVRPNPQRASEVSASSEDSTLTAAPTPAATPTTAVHTYVSEGNAQASAAATNATALTTTATAAPLAAAAWDPQAACDAAVAEVNHPLPPGFGVVCTTGFDGSHTDETTIYLNPGQLPVARVYAHELGHTWDRAELTDSEQDEWARARGYTAGFTTGEGGPCLYADGCIPPTEDFADCFACALGWCGMGYGGPAPTADQVALLWSLIG